MLSTTAQRLALLCLVAVFVATALAYPAFPVDETRYLTVAWEMRHGHWILPLLNGQPYSQKPPLLFWLINLLWTVTGGPSVWAGRLVCFLFALGALALTRELGRALFPERPALYDLAPLLAAASPLFLVFSTMILFDQLLFVAVMLGLLGLWRAGQDKGWMPWLMLGAALGLGVLAKGPVVLVDLLPPALLAPFWLPTPRVHTRAGWYGRLLVSILIGAAIGLAWAIPAAITGGADYAHMIFLGQSTGRMVNAFAHAEPVWFYIPFALVYVSPWLFMPDLWRGGRLADWRGVAPVRFLLIFLVPAFLLFSAISGKQMHYILPLTGGAAILAAYAMDTAVTRRGFGARPWFLLPYIVGLGCMVALPYLRFVRHNAKYQNLSQGVAYFEHWPFVAGIVVAAAVGWALRRRLEGQALAMVVCTCLAFCLVTGEGGLHMFKFYDLTPLRTVVQPFAGHPIAVVAPYEGEITFTTRLDQPPVVLKRDADLNAWLAAHPDGVLVLKNRITDPLPAGHVLATQLFHGDQRWSVITKP